MDIESDMQKELQQASNMLTVFLIRNNLFQRRTIIGLESDADDEFITRTDEYISSYLQKLFPRNIEINDPIFMTARNGCSQSRALILQIVESFCVRISNYFGIPISRSRSILNGLLTCYTQYYFLVAENENKEIPVAFFTGLLSLIQKYIVHDFLYFMNFR